MNKALEMMWSYGRYYCLEELRITTESLGNDSWSPDQDFNPEPPEYEVVVLIARSRSSAYPMGSGDSPWE